MIQIDFVSDISCPWCAVGLAGLQQALARVGDTVPVELRVRPFELNPQMGPEGQEVSEYLTQKYGSTAAQQAEIRETIRQRGAAAGFTFQVKGRDRIWNTFDAHRLLHWAGLPETRPAGGQVALKALLMQAYHGQGESPADYDVLCRLAGEAGLDLVEARRVLQEGLYADEVRREERFFTEAGIHSVPAVIINQQYLVSGGQPAEAYESALRQIAAELSKTA